MSSTNLLLNKKRKRADFDTVQSKKNIDQPLCTFPNPIIILSTKDSETVANCFKREDLQIITANKTFFCPNMNDDENINGSYVYYLPAIDSFIVNLSDVLKKIYDVNQVVILKLYKQFFNIEILNQNSREKIRDNLYTLKIDSTFEDMNFFGKEKDQTKVDQTKVDQTNESENFDKDFAMNHSTGHGRNTKIAKLEDPPTADKLYRNYSQQCPFEHPIIILSTVTASKPPTTKINCFREDDLRAILHNNGFKLAYNSNPVWYLPGLNLYVANLENINTKRNVFDQRILLYQLNKLHVSSKDKSTFSAVGLNIQMHPSSDDEPTKRYSNYAHIQNVNTGEYFFERVYSISPYREKTSKYRHMA